MLSYIILEQLCEAYQRERRSEADAERLLRASQARHENRKAHFAAGGLLARALRASRVAGRPWFTIMTRRGEGVVSDIA
jgi:hypothetical protein